MARQRVLWDAIESDRRRWIRATLVVLPFIVLMAFSIWVLVETGDPRAIQLVVRAVVPITAIVLFPVLRGWRAQSVPQQIGAVPVATGMASQTKSALSDVSLAAGLGTVPELYLYGSDAYNAFVWTGRGQTRIAVSSAFSMLTEEEQRAGIAMLVGRLRVDVTAFAAEHELTARKKNPPPPEDDPGLFKAWLGAAVAGDREALEFLREPVPMICLLERLSLVSTAVPDFARDRGECDACFNFLAWPYGGWWTAADGPAADKLPARAQAAVAAVIAEEMTEFSPVDHHTGDGMGNSEALRAQRLREVSGAEGAIAGSTSAADRAHAAEQVMPVAPAAVAAVPIAAAAAMPAVPIVASSPAPAVTPPAPAVTPAAPIDPAAPTAPTAATRIDVQCLSCGADNAPSNRECIRCGKKLAQQR